MCHHCTQCDTQCTHGRIDCQHITHSHIHDIHHHVRNHGANRVLHTDKPPLDCHQAQRCRCCPYADKEVLAGEDGYFRRTRDNRQGSCHKQPLQQPYQCRSQQRDSHTMRQQTCTLYPIVATVCLSGHTTRTDTQETEVPIQQIKQHRTNSYAADSMCIGDMSHNRCIHQSHQRNGDIRQDTGDCQTKDLLIHIAYIIKNRVQRYYNFAEYANIFA